VVYDESTANTKTMAAPEYLPALTEAVAWIIAEPNTHALIGALREELKQTPEPFVWATLDLKTMPGHLPDNIKSCWLFLLKKDTPSGCHYHPNSIQHMAMIEGEGTAKIGSSTSEMKRFNAANFSLPDIWYVIDEGVPHEFFPRRTDMVVISFHTCAANELEEVSCDSGAARIYEPAYPD
jgi:mannose-6-phosphate isomerase-like protein (cupin superfamily)